MCVCERERESDRCGEPIQRDRDRIPNRFYNTKLAIKAGPISIMVCVVYVCERERETDTDSR